MYVADKTGIYIYMHSFGLFICMASSVVLVYKLVLMMLECFKLISKAFVFLYSNTYN